MSSLVPNDDSRGNPLSPNSPSDGPFERTTDLTHNAFTTQARDAAASTLVLKLFRHEAISAHDYEFIRNQLQTTGESARTLRSELFSYILRAEDNFLQFIDVRKPLPLGLPELRRIDKYFSSELGPLLTSEQRIAWFKRIVSHLAHLGNYSTWDATHLEQLAYSTSTLCRLRTTDLLANYADTPTRNEFQHAIASVFQRASRSCDELSVYPALYEGMRGLSTLPIHVFSAECKAGIQALHAELRAFLPEANQELDEDERESTFLGYRLEQGPPIARDNSIGNRSWEIDLPKLFLEQILNDSPTADLTEEQLQQIGDTQYAFSALVCLTTQVTMTLADLSDAQDCSAMRALCYEYSFHEPEWLHYVRGLARADTQGAVLAEVVADLLRAATYR